MMRWQTELVAIPAPPFGEAQRSLWMAERFREAGLQAVQIDSIGNVYAELTESGDTPVVVLSAHLDTVFPADTPLNPIVQEDRLEAPSACDNAAGVIGMLSIAHALTQTSSTAIRPMQAGSQRTLSSTEQAPRRP
jgi:acetylornithine deacetylase/succinyl-diaminopimelate desuccinylase-like protein